MLKIVIINDSSVLINVLLHPRCFDSLRAESCHERKGLTSGCQEDGPLELNRFFWTCLRAVCFGIVGRFHKENIATRRNYFVAVGNRKGKSYKTYPEEEERREERKSKSRYFGRRFKEGGGKKGKKEEERRKKKNKANFKENLRECWLCETVKHFRYECLRKEENSGKFVNWS